MRFLFHSIGQSCLGEVRVTQLIKDFLLFVDHKVSLPTPQECDTDKNMSQVNAVHVITPYFRLFYPALCA